MGTGEKPYGMSAFLSMQGPGEIRKVHLTEKRCLNTQKNLRKNKKTKTKKVYNAFFRERIKIEVELYKIFFQERSLNNAISNNNRDV